MPLKNYTLGRGEIHFGRLNTTTLAFGPFRYLGNTPEMNITIESDELAHYSSDHGVGEKDASIPTTMNRSMTISGDEITYENVAMYLFGTMSTIAITAMAAVQVDTIVGVNLGYGYALGLSEADPVGALKVIFPGSGGTLFRVTGPAGTPVHVAGTDYIFDQKTMLVTPLKGGAITEGATIQIHFAEAAYSTKQIMSGAVPYYGRIRYIEDNPAGENKIWNFPNVVVRPNGDFAMKAESEWQVLPFSVELLRGTGSQEAIYMNGLPFTP